VNDQPVVRPVLQSLFSMSCPEGLENYRPDDAKKFAVHVMAFIGTGDEYVGSFDFVACTPSWLAARFPEGDDSVRLVGSSDVHWVNSLLIGAGFVFMAEWSYDELTAAVELICSRHAGPDWGAVASRIGRSLPWEFDYKYDRFLDQNPGPAFPPIADT
jgi:Immunity protein 8